VANLLDIVESTLHAEGAPLTVAEITKRILEAKAWTTKGKTPEATFEARLAVDVKDNAEASRFVRVARRTYALRVWPGQEPAPAKPKAGLMTYLEAAEKILAASKEHQPLHAKEITERAIASGYLSPSGLTPAATMYVQLMTDVKRRKERGDQPQFWQLPKGRFGLADWQDADLVAQVGHHNRETKKKLLAQLHAMKWEDFEDLIGELLVKLGFEEVDVTERHGDHGVDVRAILVTAGVIRTVSAVQVKRWKANVQAPTVQAVRGSLGVHEQGLIVTTSDFSDGAREQASRPDAVPVALMNGEDLVSLLVEHEIGVIRHDLDLLELAPTNLAAE
jgi:restriction system protein